MDFSCLNCNSVTKLEVNFEIEFFACPNCKTLYSIKSNNELVFKEQFSKESYENAFSVGQTAVFDDEQYTITGILIKSNESVYEWSEYILQSSKGKFIYVSEFDGHFILLEEIEFNQKVGDHPLLLDYKEMKLNRYDYYYPKLEYASGFFDFDVLNKIELIEYISPPYLLSFEKFGKEQTTFYGKHISRSQIKKAFQSSEIPPKKGIGMVQPFIVDIQNLAIAFCLIAILILLSHWYLNIDRTEKNVLKIEIPFKDFSDKDFVSPSFELKGSAAPLDISVSSNVDNSWANVEVGLINEKSADVEIANKDIEYYHGYSEGENWTEGNTSEEFNICGVSEGKYHLTITPKKGNEDISNSSISVKATWNKPSFRNVWMSILFMGIFAVVMYYLSKNYEEKRWL